MSVVAFAFAAAAGAVLRVRAAEVLNRPAVPWGTLLVNISGSLAVGIVAGWWPLGVTVFGVALLGSFTTFSTFALETTALWRDNRRGTCAAYVGITAVAAVAAAWVGLLI